jgi:hypothetical protein
MTVLAQPIYSDIIAGAVILIGIIAMTVLILATHRRPPRHHDDDTDRHAR